MSKLKTEVINLFSELNISDDKINPQLFLTVSELISNARIKQLDMVKKFNKIINSDNIISAFYNLDKYDLSYVNRLTHNNNKMGFVNINKLSSIKHDTKSDSILAEHKIIQQIKTNINMFESLYVSGDVMFTIHTRNDSAKLIKNFKMFGIELCNNSYKVGVYSKRYITNFQPFQKSKLEYKSIHRKLIINTLYPDQGRVSIMNNTESNIRKLVRHHQSILRKTSLPITKSTANSKFHIGSQFDTNKRLELNQSNISVKEDRIYDSITQLKGNESKMLQIDKTPVITIDITACLPSFLLGKYNTEKDLYQILASKFNHIKLTKHTITRAEIKKAFIILFNQTKASDWKAVDHVEDRKGMGQLLRKQLEGLFSEFITKTLKQTHDNIRQYLYKLEAKFVRYDLFNFASDTNRLKDLNTLQKHDEFIIQNSNKTIKLFIDYLIHQQKDYHWLNFKLNDELNLSYAELIDFLQKVVGEKII